MDNISKLYNKKPKPNIAIYLIFFLSFITLIVYSIKEYTYDIKELLVINECNENECFLKSTLNYNDQEIFSNKSYIKYKDKKYEIKDIEYGEPYLSNETPVTDMSIKTDLIEEAKILKIKVYYNKQRIIKKIKEKIIERN